jgi:LuxR family maltose regulon positive regulatory protein
MKQGLALLPWWGKADDSALAHITLARIHLAEANRRDAIEAVEKAIHVIQTSGVFWEARHAAEIAQVKLWLAQGDRQAANRWAASQEERLSADDPFRFENELAHITLARVYMAQKKLDEATRLLSHLRANAQSGGRTGRLIEIMILQALAMQKLGEPAQALAVLAKSLALAEPEKYIRVFLDEDQPMQMLLAQWLAHAGDSPLRDYAIRLLSQFDAEPHVVTAAQEKVSPTGDPSASHVVSPVEPSGQALVEPLSERELEVLHLMALGRTNQEIARQLIVAPGTVKAHTASIYRKLDVANRTEAVARARQLGILP